jgi:hypothetical protein
MLPTGLDVRSPFGIVFRHRASFAQAPIQFDVQLDDVACQIAAQNLKVLGLAARFAEDGKSVGFRGFQSGSWVGLIVFMRVRL